MYKGINKATAYIVIIAMLVAGLLAGCNEQPYEESTSGAYNITYLEYISMPAEQKQAYMNQFSTVEEQLAFIQWLNAEEEKYEATRP